MSRRGSMDRKSFSWLVVMAATLTLCVPVLGQRSGLDEKAMNYGGKWWLSVASLEQRGYINGDFDCDTWEVGNRSVPNSTAEDVQKFVNEFYVDPPHWPVPVFRVIQTFYSHEAKQADGGKPSDGEVRSEPHGYWDGLWWKGAGYPNTLEQLGYVEGYLACYEGEAHSPRGTFSKAPAQYVSLISGWYKRTGKEDAKIADVLFKFRDQELHSKSGSK
jgi:hypothetical protein